MGRNIGIILSLRDKFSPDIKKMAQNVGKTEKEVKKARMEIIKFQKGLSDVAKNAKNASIGFGVTAGIVTAAMVPAIKSFIDKASDMNETVNKIDTVFEGSAKAVKKWSESSIEMMGLAGQSALDSAALYGDMATGMGLSEEKAAGMGMALTQLGADLASFKNVSNDMAQTALKGIFTGETESLKNLGIVMTQANLQNYAMSKGIKKKIEKMTEQEKIQLRYNYVMAKTTKAQGDFLKTGGGAANQERMNAEIWKELGTNLGQIFLPEYTARLIQFNQLIKSNMPQIIQIVSTTFNVISSGIGFLADNMNWIIPIAVSLISTFAAFNIINGVVTMIASLQSVIEAVTVVQGFWNAVMLVNPIGVIAISIGALIGVIALLIVNWDKVAVAASGAWKAMKNAVKASPIGFVASKMNEAKSTFAKKPHHATGTSYTRAGVARVGEKGPEDVMLPGGAKVVPNNKISDGRPIIINFNIDGNMIGTKEFIDYLCNMLAQVLSAKMAVA